MVVWALRALGADPAFFVGGEVPGLGPDGAAANAGWGEGEWVVAEADESDASFLRLRARDRRDHQHRDGPPLALGLGGRAARRLPRFADRRGRGRARGRRAATARGECRRRRLRRRRPGPSSSSSPFPAATTCSTPAPPWRRSGSPALDVGAAAAALAGFPGVRRRLELKGERDGPAIYDDYAHHPTEVRAALSALRELGPERLIAVFQPHLYSRTKAFAEEFGAALALADEAVVLDVYPAREEPVGELAGVSGLHVARAAADRMGGRPVWWLPTAGAGARRALERRASARDGSWSRSAPATSSRSPRRWSREGGDERAARGRRARLPAGAPDHGPHRRRRRLVRPARRRGAPGRAARLGRGRGAARSA